MRSIRIGRGVMAERAVIDRVEEGSAVLLIGDDEKEFVVPLRELPVGSEPGVWLTVTLTDSGRLQTAQIDSETTKRRRALMQERLDQLLKRQPKQE